MKTEVINTKSIKRNWYIIDANNMVVGRLASEVAKILMGKGKVAYSPNQDHGDHVIVINASGVKVTGNKENAKVYFRHSQYPGGAKFRTFKEQMSIDPSQVVIHAVKGMLPKTNLGRAMLKKLRVYNGSEHPHVAQKPETIKIG